MGRKKNLEQGFQASAPPLRPGSRWAPVMFGCHSAYKSVGRLPILLSNAAMRAISVTTDEARNHMNYFSHVGSVFTGGSARRCTLGLHVRAFLLDLIVVFFQCILDFFFFMLSVIKKKILERHKQKHGTMPMISQANCTHTFNVYSTLIKELMEL